MNDCIFCKIVSGEVPATAVYYGPTVTAFRDINPQAPTHILIIPNRHIADICDADATSGTILNEMIEAANEVAQSEGIAESGYRLMFNYGPDADLTVPHLHMHLLGGRKLGPMVMPR